MTPGLVHRLIVLLFTPSDCSETHPIIASYSLSFPGAAGDFLVLLYRKINRIVFSAGKFNRIRCQTHTKIACGAIRCTNILTGNLHPTFRSNLHQNFTSLDLHQKFRSSGEIVRLQREATDQLHAPLLVLIT